MAHGWRYFIEPATLTVQTTGHAYTTVQWPGQLMKLCNGNITYFKKFLMMGMGKLI